MPLSDIHYRQALIDKLADIHRAFQFAEFSPKFDDVFLGFLVKLSAFPARIDEGVESDVGHPAR